MAEHRQRVSADISDTGSTSTLEASGHAGAVNASTQSEFGRLIDLRRQLSQLVPAEQAFDASM